MKKPFPNLLALSASLGWLGLAASPVLQAQCLPFGFETKLSPPPSTQDVPTDQAKFGDAVAIDGDTIVVGAPNVGEAPYYRGAAYVQTRGGVLVKELNFPSLTSIDFGDRVAISSDFVAVADSLEGGSAGAVYLYSRANYDADPIPLVAGTTSRFGSGLALEGTTLVVGAHGDNKAYIYEYAEGDWVSVGTLAPPAPSSPTLSDLFGWAVAISGNRISVGAPGRYAGQGAVFVFERSAGGWAQATRTEITGSQTVADDNFGYSVALEGDRLVVGAPSRDLGNNGAVYVFTRDTSQFGWGQPAKLQGSPSTAYDSFGYSVALRGSYILVGSPGVSGGAGAAAAFSFLDSWGAAQPLGREGGWGFGTSVALGAGFAVVGAPLTFDYIGAAYVYSFPLVLADEKVTVHYHDHNAPGVTTDSSGYSKADIRGDIGFAVPGVIPMPQAHVMAWLGSELIASAPVLFDIGGHNGDKWEAKPASGPVEKFKIHWYEAVEFDAIQSNPASPKIKSKFIGLTETELRYEAKAGTYQTTFPAHGVTVNVVSGKITAISGATTSEIELDKKAADITLGSRLVPGEQIITTGGITDTITVTAGVNLQSAQGKFELKLRQDAAFAQPLFTVGAPLRYEIILGTDGGACAAGGASVVGVAPKPWDADDNNHKRYREDTSD
jgi:hypothetical protein